MTAADYPDWSAPQAHATAIASTGVPLLTGAASILASGVQSVPHGAAYVSAVLPVSQIGYELLVQAQYPSAATVPYAMVQLLWKDSASGLIVDTDDWVVPGATSPAYWFVRGHGPTKANQVQVKIINFEPAQSLSAQINILQNSRVYTVDDWRWNNFQNTGLTVPNVTVAPVLPQDETILGIVNNVSVAASSSKSWLAGMYDGEIQVGYSSGGSVTLSSEVLAIKPVPDSQYSAYQTILSQTPPAGNQMIIGVRAPLLVTVTNNSTTTALTAVVLLSARTR